MEHKTALHVAVEKGNLEIIYLLSKREDIDYNALDGILNIFSMIFNSYIINDF